VARTRRPTAAPGRTAICTLAAVLALAAPASPGHAQQTPEPDSTAVIPISPVTVSVLRGPVGAGREPYAVGSLGTTALRQGKTGAFLEEALHGLPGVQVQNRFNYAVGERLSIRGFGPRAQFGVRGVRIMIDGIPATFPDGQSAMEHIDLGSVGRAQVLRGPASALYGNAAGGVITFESRLPDAGPYHQEARAVFGSHGLLNVQALASGTAGTTGFLASVSRLSYDGFRTNAATDGTYGAAERWGANVRLIRPLGSGRLSITANALDLDAENPGSLSAALLADRGSIAFAGNVTAATGKTIRQGQLGAAWETDNAEVAAWGISRDVRNPIPGTIIDLDRMAGGTRALLRGQAESGLGRINWGVGGELEFQQDDRQNYANLAGTNGDLRLDQTEDVLATGAFAQARLAPTSMLELSTALRYDRFRFEAKDRFVGPGRSDDSGERVMDALSPSVGVFLDVSRALGLYANLATALETPTTTELANRPDGAGGFNPDVEPQRARTIEGGLRGQALQRVSYEVTLFHTDLENELVPFEDPAQPGRTFFRNAGSSTHRGVEAAVRSALTDMLSAQLTWSRVDARFDAYQRGTSDFSGNRVPGLAPNRVQGLLRAETGRGFADVTWEWTDEIPVNDQEDEYSPSFKLVNLRGGTQDVRAFGLAFSPFFGVSNLLDTTYNSAVTVNAFGRRFFEPGPGRTFHLGLTAAFTR